MNDPVKQFKERNTEFIQNSANDQNFVDLTQKWLEAATKHEYSYHFTSLSRPIIQFPQDMIAVQELIWEVKPDLIIETGIAHGGSLIMSAAMLAQIDYCDAVEAGETLDPKASKRKVLGIDIDIRSHNRKALENHPMFHKIEIIEGSSVDDSVIKQVHEYAKDYKNIMVFLDSMHTHDHVLAELNAYADLTAVGSYCVVFDTIVEFMPDDYYPNRPWSVGNNPKTATDAFLKTTDSFIVDEKIHNKLQVTVANGGYLKRIK